MKLIKENLNKLVVGSSMIYTYSCDGSEFVITIDGIKQSRRYIVFKRELIQVQNNSIIRLMLGNILRNLFLNVQESRVQVAGLMRNAPQEPEHHALFSD